MASSPTRGAAGSDPSAPVLPNPRGGEPASLTQRNARSGRNCERCGDERLTEITMTLTDGTAVEFVSCHHCETKSWRNLATGPDGELGFDTVLSHTRKVR